MEPNLQNERMEAARLIEEIKRLNPRRILLQNDLLEIVDFTHDYSGFVLKLLNDDLETMLLMVDEVSYKHISIPDAPGCQPAKMNGEVIVQAPFITDKGYNDEHVKYLRDAMSIMGVMISPEIAELIITTHEKIKTMGGDFSLRDAAKIKVAVQKKYRRKEEESAEDKRFNELRPDYTPAPVVFEEA